MRNTPIFAAILLGWLLAPPVAVRARAQSQSTAAQANPPGAEEHIPPNFVPSGKEMFKQYCAACHGLDAKGHGPARAALRVPAADLTTLSKRHNGEFPYDLVTNILRFGPGLPAHGSSDMPTWGGIFQYMDNYNQAAVQKRIKNLCDYIASLQEK